LSTNITSRQISGGAISNLLNEEFRDKNILGKSKKVLSISKS